jgi:predicted nucleic acid-binding protein
LRIYCGFYRGRPAAARSLRYCRGDLPPISNPLFDEYVDASFRRRVRNACPLSKGEIRELLNAFYSVCIWVPAYYSWRPNLGDEGDNFLIELALAGNSGIIVTNNVRDLVAAELEFDDLRVLTPQQL